MHFVLEPTKLISDATLASLRAIPNVAEATAILTPYAQTIKLQGQEKKNWANITGYDPANDVFNLDVTHGRKLTSTDMDKILVGSQFVQDMGYGGHEEDLLGKNVLLTFKFGPGSGPDWGPEPEKPPVNADKSWYEARGNAGQEIPAEIVGILANGTLDNGQSYINIAWARRLNVQVRWEWSESKPQGEQNCQTDPQTGKISCGDSQPSTPTMTLVKDDQFPKNGYNTIILRVDDQKNIKEVAAAVTALGYGANTAQAMLDQINQILLVIGVVLAAIGGISLFVASIGIINTMIMATFERTREIGVMRACGATKGTIQRLFTFEAGLLGFFGGTFGLIISLVLGQVAQLMLQRFGSGLGNIPIEKIGSFPWWLIVAVITFTTLLGMVAGLYPAIRASRMNPVEALRYE